MRHQDWPSRLSRMVAESHNLPFAWGVHDCCLFAANIVKEITGDDPAASLRGTYSTALEAARILKERGGVRGMAADALGPEISPKLAQRGDVVMVKGEHGDTLAVCMGTYCVAPCDKVLGSVPMAQAVTAWRVE